MSDDEEPKFIKPGDDPVLDHALDELRFDSGLYQRGEYDIFGRRRGLGRSAEEGQRPDEGDADGKAARPAAAAPVVVPAARKRARPKLKAWVAAGAVAAALAPVVIYATVWKPP